MPFSAVDNLLQANLELHEELGKEVRINLENEAKIKRLERQQTGYEKDIQYLYGVIEKLESQRESDKKEICSLESQIVTTQTQLKKILIDNDEKEKFILFRESQLLELENTINNLKYQSKMASTSRTRPALGSMSNTQLLAEIQTNVTQLRMYCEGVKLPNVGVATELATRTERASLLIHNTLVGKIDELKKNLEECETKCAVVKDTLLDQLQEAKSSITKLEHGFEGIQVELRLKESEVDRLTILCDEQDVQLRDLTNRLENRERRAERLEMELAESHDAHEELRTVTRRLAEASEQVRLDLERAGQALAERDTLINNYQIRLERCYTERGIIENRYLREQVINRSLIRQRFALRIANRQLQIRLMNPPPVIQPVEQIWLLL